MCGRFTLATAPAALVELFGLDELPQLGPRYNVAPGQDVATVRVVLDQGDGRRVLRMLHWGLVPSWAKDSNVGYRMINARSETVASKPAFRAALRRRRCLVLADGFYEWQKLSRAAKQPHLYRMVDGTPFAFAGLWERWDDPQGETLESCTVITCPANELVARVHPRMPVILPPAAQQRWLDPEQDDPAQLTPLLLPYPAEAMQGHPVSNRVNSPRFDDAACIAPAEQPPPARQGELPL